MESIRNLFLAKCDSDNPTCFVPDVFGSECKIIFVLESPDKKEVVAGHPAAGATGNSMRNRLLPEKIGALGKLIHEGDAPEFGIMNICNYPMQCRGITDYIRSTFKSVGRLERILHGSKKTGNYQSNDVIGLAQEIYNDFSGRFLSALCKYKSVITPCGEFAQAFVEYFVSLHPECMQDLDSYFPNWTKGIPHPSYGHWAESRDNAKVKKMCAVIKKALYKAQGC